MAENRAASELGSELKIVVLVGCGIFTGSIKKGYQFILGTTLVGISSIPPDLFILGDKVYRFRQYLSTPPVQVV